MKNNGQPMRDSVPWNFQCTKDPRWLNNVFLFSTEIWADQLKKNTLYNSMTRMKHLRIEMAKENNTRFWNDNNIIHLQKEFAFHSGLFVGDQLAMLLNDPDLYLTHIFGWLLNNLKCTGQLITHEFFANDESLCHSAKISYQQG